MNLEISGNEITNAIPGMSVYGADAEEAFDVKEEPEDIWSLKETWEEPQDMQSPEETTEQREEAASEPKIPYYFVEGNWDCHLNDYDHETVVIYHYRGNEEEFLIPDVIRGRRVTGIEIGIFSELNLNMRFLAVPYRNFNCRRDWNMQDIIF